MVGRSNGEGGASAWRWVGRRRGWGRGPDDTSSKQGSNGREVGAPRTVSQNPQAKSPSGARDRGWGPRAR